MRPGRIYTPAPLVEGHPLNRGLVSWWLPLPGLDGGRFLYDVAGQNHGTLTNGPTWTAGPNGFGAVQFDGADDYVERSAFAWDPSGGYTYSLAVRPGFASTSKTRQGVVCWRASGAGDQNRVRLIWLDATSGFYLDDRDRYAFSARPTFGAGEWHHLAVTKPASGAAQYYWDGSPFATTTVIDLGGVEPANSYPLYLGWDSEAAGRVWSGLMADVRIHSRALSASEVAALYDQSLRGHPDTLRRVSGAAWFVGSGGGGGGNRRRRVLLTGGR